MHKKVVKVKAHKRRGRVVASHEQLRSVNEITSGSVESRDATQSNLLHVANDSTGEDVVHALKHPDWASNGFDSSSDWNRWAFLGYFPEDARGNPAPRFDRTRFNYYLKNAWSRPTVDWTKFPFPEETDLSGIFCFTSFNEDISDWDVSNCVEFDTMFLKAENFNQCLGKWNIGNAQTLKNMFWGSGMSAENLSATLVGWVNQNRFKIPNNITLGGIPVNYEDLSTEANLATICLRKQFGWVIYDKKQILDMKLNWNE